MTRVASPDSASPEFASPDRPARSLVARARPALLAAPALSLAAAGLLHPHGLTYDTASMWTTLHVLGIFAFPLVGVALAWLVGLRTDALAWAVRVTAFVYATAYSALDVVNGVAAGYMTWRLGPDVPRPRAISVVFKIGGDLGTVGSYALLAACLLLVLDVLGRFTAAVTLRLPVLALLPGAYLVHTHHIFAPLGVLGMVLIGLGAGYVAWLAARPSATG